MNMNRKIKDGVPRQAAFSYDEHRSCLKDELIFWKSLEHPYHGNDEKMRSGIGGMAKFIKLAEFYNDTVRILDIGCGPSSPMGPYSSQTTHITAIDALAHEYAKMPTSTFGVRPISILAEDIGKVFPDGYFHIIYAANSIDHVACPLQVIQNISHALHDNGLFILKTHKNEASRRNYSGLHRSNLFIRKNGDLMEEDSGIKLLSTTDLTMVDYSELDNEIQLGVFAHFSSDHLLSKGGV